MNPYIARQRVSRNPLGRIEFTGKYDDDGEPVIKSVPERFLPGEIIIPWDNDELAFLESVNAIRPMTELELVMYEKGHTSGFAPDNRDA